MVWYVCAQAVATSASNGLALRIDFTDGEPLMSAVLLLFLVIVGIGALRIIDRRRGPLRDVLGLPVRTTSGEEWAMGAAAGWGIAIASVVPLALAHALNIQIWNAPHAYYLLMLSLATLAVLTLAHTVIIFGYALPRLIEATGPARATLILIGIVAIYAALFPVSYDTPQGTRLMAEMLATLLLGLCWLRTHAVWMAWGLHFGWAISIGVLFGLPLGGNISFGSVVDTRAIGPLWLTGGSYGPAAAVFTVVVLLASIPVLVRITADYAWDYTHAPIVAGGYDVTVDPPAAHVAMEQQSAAAQPALVQIQPVASSSPGADQIPK